MNDIKNLTLKDLEEFFSFKNLPVFRAKQIFSWIYQKRIRDFSLMTNISKDLKDLLREEFYFGEIIFVEKRISKDKTEKFLFKLGDGNFIESVFIPMGQSRKGALPPRDFTPRGAQRFTGCISTQVGCKYNCLFCASAKLGFKRNLTAGEIVAQILYLKDYKKDVDPVRSFAARGATSNGASNIVFMGIGEPLDNYDNLLKVIRIINDKNGLNIGARKITISTCGLIPQIEKLSNENLQIELSVSLHASNDKTRDNLMPINKTYPLNKLIEVCRNYYKKTNRQITFEYVLIKDINSSLQDARNLATILQGFDAKVNLIIYNENPYNKFRSPTKDEVNYFAINLEKNKIKFTIRTPRGKDIDAACGQLRLNYEPRPS